MQAPKSLKKLFCLLLLSPTLLFAAVFSTTQLDIDDYDGAMVASWNALVIEAAIKEDGLLTLKGVRAAAMLHTAMHDAVNAIMPVYAQYAISIDVDGAHPAVAAAQAAYEVTVSQYPNSRPRFDAELKKWLTPIENTAGRAAGIVLGKAAAAAILKQRHADSYDGEAEYTWHPMAPGVYAEFSEHSGTPEGFVFGAGWAKAKPFLLKKQDQFRCPPPPNINSDAYTAAFKEVKEAGSTMSQTRTPDQTHLAMWWKDFVENSHNRLARELATKEKLNLWRASRLFALLNMAIHDGYVSSFDNKFHYNHWRPYTAIRWAVHDGNADTKPDTAWNNLHRHTYAFPSYPSAHGTASAAAMTMLADTFGDLYALTITTTEVDSAGPFSGKMKMQPTTRSFASFSEAALECAMSRVYLGIHFRYDSVEGNKLGTQVGRYGVEQHMSPIQDDKASSKRQ